MYDCLAFNVIDLSPFPNVVTIGDNFLEGTNVMYVNMTTFAHQPEIQTGINFLSRCDNLIYVDMGDIKAENVNVTGSTEDHSFSAYCNLTALSVVLGIIIAGRGCSQYLGRFTNGISGA